MEYKSKSWWFFFAISTCILLGTNWVLTGYTTINILQLVLFDNSFDTLSHQIWRTWWFKWAHPILRLHRQNHVLRSYFLDDFRWFVFFFYRYCDFFGWFWRWRWNRSPPASRDASSKPGAFHRTLWWTNILLWKITIFHGKIHYFNGHFPLLFVCSPEGTQKFHQKRGPQKWCAWFLSELRWPVPRTCRPGPRRGWGF